MFARDVFIINIKKKIVFIAYKSFLEFVISTHYKLIRLFFEVFLFLLITLKRFARLNENNIFYNLINNYEIFNDLNIILFIFEKEY